MKKIMSTLLAFVIALTITAVAPLVQPVVAQTTIYVDADATGANDGTSWADAYTDLQSALSTTTSGDEIRVAQGTYYPGTNRTDSFAMKNGVAIYGGYAGYGESDPDNRNIFAYPTILSGDIGAAGYAADNCYHVFFHIILTNLDSTAVLDGFTITGGNADGSGDRLYGGGMFNEESSPTVTNCIFSDNTANYGGGMYNDGSSPTVTNCTFNNNSAYYGSGMYNYSSSSPTVTNCTFSGNTAVYGGGGMYNEDDCSPTVVGCTFNNNWVADDGGGMYNVNSSPTVTNCTFSGNTADFSGGGMYNHGSSTTVTNCTFSGNTAVYGGGGMYNYSSSSTTVTNCTFSSNSVDYGGGGMCNTDSSPTVTNCVLWGDAPDEIHNTDRYCEPAVTYCDIHGGYSGAGNIDADPLLDGSLRLQAGSPCIDAGNNAAVPSGVTTDFEGDPRFLDDPGMPDTGSGTPPIVDMGADEFAAGSGPQYTITAAAGTGGTISPSGNVKVYEGDDQTFTITPDAGYSIADVLVDGSPVGAVETYTFNAVEADHTIQALFAQVNFPPVANDDYYSIVGDNTLDVWAPGVLGNDYDPDDDDITVIYNDPAANGVVTISPDGYMSYTPNAGFRGTDSFEYTVSDGKGGTDTATVTITVNPTGLEQILDRLDDIESKIDNLEGGTQKLDIEFLLQAPSPNAVIYQFGISLNGLPVDASLHSAHGMKIVDGQPSFGDVTNDVWQGSQGTGHLALIINLPDVVDYWMFQFVFEYDDGGIIRYGTCHVVNNNFAPWNEM